MSERVARVRLRIKERRHPGYLCRLVDHFELPRLNSRKFGPIVQIECKRCGAWFEEGSTLPCEGMYVTEDRERMFAEIGGGRNLIPYAA